jgi:hypothetical protein
VTDPVKATEPSDILSNDPVGVIAAVTRYRDEVRGRFNSLPEPWWIQLPLRYLATADERKREYLESGLHGWYGLTGFQCVGDGFGQTYTFTYDSEKKEWNR